MRTEEMSMNQAIDRAPKLRIANFSNVDVPVEHILNFDSEDTETIINKIRRYADLPYVYVVAKDKAAQVNQLLSALKAMRSPCYPYAIVSLDRDDVDAEDLDLDVVKVVSTDAETIKTRIYEYASERLVFNENKLRIKHPGPLPAKVDVTIIGAGVTGLYAANRLQEAGISFCVLEKENRVGGIWSLYANRTSQVNTSESAYRLFEKRPGPITTTLPQGRYWKILPIWQKMCRTIYSLAPRSNK
jgi:hypothetical protein